jgi:hypothetical protein
MKLAELRTRRTECINLNHFKYLYFIRISRGLRPENDEYYSDVIVLNNKVIFINQSVLYSVIPLSFKKIALGS